MKPQEERDTLAGPAGRLEYKVRPVNQPKAVAVICHPNPQAQGTMDNKVVTICSQAFYHMGVSSVMFNYRGVGHSEGAYGDIIGEQADAQAVIDWASSRWPNCPLVLAGFSFGAYIAARCANRCRDVRLLLSLAPPADRYDFAALSQIDCPWWVVATQQDEIVPYAAVQQWLAQHQQLHTWIWPDASHFFHGQLLALRQGLIERLGPMIDPD